MKRITAIMMALAFALISLGQENTRYLIGDGDKRVTVSGFTSLDGEFSTIGDDLGFSMGAGAAVLLSQTFFIGGYGTGLVTRHTRDLERLDGFDFFQNSKYEDLRVRFGHGGIWLGVVFNPRSPINVGVNTRIGWGAISLTDKTYHWYDSWENIMFDPVFVLTPHFDLNLNLLRWFRMNIGIGYRFVTGIDKTYEYLPNNHSWEDPVEKAYFNDNAFNGVSGSISFLFGWFHQ